MSSALAIAVPTITLSDSTPPDDGDRDGHFDGDEHEFVKETLSKLNHVPTRLWTYLGVARRARLVKPPAKGEAHVPRQITATSLLTDAEYRALTALVMYGSKDLSDSYPGLPKLAKSDNWVLRSLARAVQQLVEKGWVTRAERSPLGTAVNQFYIPAGVLAPWADAWKCPGGVKAKKRQ